MEKINRVFIATSIDGYIAGKNGEIDWLHSVPNPDHLDMGYGKFIEQTDALVMGRKTFETVCGLDIEWPYPLPVYVLSNTMNTIPEKYRDAVQLVKGTPGKILERIHRDGYFRLYIDGGTTIQNFLQEDMIDEMTITIIPVLLGGGSPLFSDLPGKLHFECIKSEVFLGKIVQNHFRRVR